MSELTFYKCSKCGEILYKAAGDASTPQCCDDTMVKLTPNTTDAATEKHVPALSVGDDGKLHVQIGSTLHPMLPEHYIQFIAIDRGNGFVTFKHLKPGDAPTASFCKPTSNATVYEYCNIHGLWKADYTA